MLSQIYMIVEPSCLYVIFLIPLRGQHIGDFDMMARHVLSQTSLTDGIAAAIFVKAA